MVAVTVGKLSLYPTQRASADTAETPGLRVAARTSSSEISRNLGDSPDGVLADRTYATPSGLLPPAAFHGTVPP